MSGQGYTHINCLHGHTLLSSKHTGEVFLYDRVRQQVIPFCKQLYKITGKLILAKCTQKHIVLTNDQGKSFQLDIEYLRDLENSEFE